MEGGWLRGGGRNVIHFYNGEMKKGGESDSLTSPYSFFSNLRSTYRRCQDFTSTRPHLHCCFKSDVDTLRWLHYPDTKKQGVKTALLLSKWKEPPNLTPKWVSVVIKLDYLRDQTLSETAPQVNWFVTKPHAGHLSDVCFLRWNRSFGLIRSNSTVYNNTFVSWAFDWSSAPVSAKGPCFSVHKQTHRLLYSIFWLIVW